MLPIAYEAARREGLIGLVDAEGRYSRVNVVLRGVSSADTLTFVRVAEARAAEVFGGAVLATGLPRLSAQLSLDSSKAMIVSMLFTLASVSLLLFVSLRDARLGLISLVPNLVPILAAFGIWGFWVGEVSFAATVVGALTFGIIVDDTVHILVKYRLVRREGHAPGPAIVDTFRSVGIPVVATSIALAASFAVFTFSGFLVNQHLGWLTAIVIIAALIADLFFLPPLLLAFEKPAHKPASAPASGVGL
jgi:predicted RND superfamily exporter protein